MKVRVTYTNDHTEEFNNVVVYVIDDEKKTLSIRLNNKEIYGLTLYVCKAIYVDDFCEWNYDKGILPKEEI